MTRRTFRKIITSEELTTQINVENIKLMNKFLREKNTRSSDLTIEAYRSDITIFLTWNLLENKNKLFTDIRKIEFSEFFAYGVEELKWGSGRFSRAKAALSSFSNFIEKFYDIEYPTFRNIILKAVESMPKNPTREKTILTDEQINNLLEHFSKEDIQIACWFALAISSGSRFSELIRFNVDVIDINNVAFDGLFIETLKPIKTKGRTKTGKMLYKYIIKNIFVPYYEKWLIERKNILDKNNKNHNSIFIKNNGDPALESTVRGWVTKIEDYLGIPFYPHSTRHYFTSYLSKASLPYNLIQEICGWESSEMVKIYDDNTLKGKKFSELDNLRNNLKNIS